jgi:predicted nucleic acid-binding protein
VAEVFVCDTSVVGHLSDRRRYARARLQWGELVLGRLNSAILAISVVTIAESRAGFLIDRWGAQRTRRVSLGLERFLQIPLSGRDLDEWARLRAAAKENGIAIGDNDLWIAATASVREHVLVTCDRDHVRIGPELAVEVLYLQPPV